MKVRFYLPILMLGLWACNADNEAIVPDRQTLPSEVSIMVPDTTDAVTLETVERVAGKFWENAAQTRSVGEKSIESVLTVSSEEGTPQLYVVNYANKGGFLVVSATKDYEPVLAYSEHGSLDPSAEGNIGLSQWLNEQKYIIGQASNFPDSLKLKYRSAWMDCTSIEKKMPVTRSYEDVIFLISSQYNQWVAEGHTVYFVSDYMKTAEYQSLPQEIQEKIRTLPMGYANPNYGGRDMVSFVVIENENTNAEVSPLLTTTWNQIGGFNSAVPNGMELGCSAVAIGQVMRYHEYPANYDWSGMPDNYANSVNSMFLYLVGQTIGLDYAHGDAGASIDEMLAALKEFGYSRSAITAHSASVCRGQLRLQQPVIMTGDNTEVGHGWVCDGFRSSSSSRELYLRVLEDCPVDYEPQRFLEILHYNMNASSSEYLHMNWGWGGIDDGYFLDANLSGAGVQLDYLNNRKDIIDIYPVN